MTAIESIKVALLSTVVVACCGCHSLSEPSASFASVIIPNRSVAEIWHATATVFLENGYKTAHGAGEGLVWEKKGTLKQTILYEEGFHNGPMLERVRAEIVPLSDGAHRLQCRACLVRDAGDSFFEEEVRLANISSKSYQALLEKAAAQLK
jgi:hypothetical protein